MRGGQGPRGGGKFGSVSSVCSDGACRAATCADGGRNGGEDSLDCGVPACAPCADASDCGEAGECRSGVCARGKCAAPVCEDRVRTGNESDVGRGNSCGVCGLARECTVASDCATEHRAGAKCAYAARCKAPLAAGDASTGTHTTAPTAPARWSLSPPPAR